MAAGLKQKKADPTVRASLANRLRINASSHIPRYETLRDTSRHFEPRAEVQHNIDELLIKLQVKRGMGVPVPTP